MEPFRTLQSRTIVLAQQNIDTDQIIPARFLKITHRTGLGRWLFADWRYQPDGSPRPDFILERPEAQGAQVLVAGDNFGCGSSREHAPWALTDWGFRAVISSSIADIFSNNAVKNGLLPVRVDAGFHRRLLAEPGSVVSIDLERLSVTLADGTAATFPLDPFARYCLMNGVDELGFLLGQEKAIARFEETRP
ncbi:3-isopropylmalate dehydratase small subunit [Stigmatella aurantiaca]|uniref:3-isopropylmalate dehydratase small subunit n=1 Tax=Stigmatella aurantiaca (strain DW4/3-1) TaxID=378806 RepID=E3FDY1_STIAD|nr:3-isopropylmalate dehydratase small subunit [Stigmatella aurantiaca]ADO71396.1 3-isopropylmalate dehydratase, small subunit [Stigmatella aurantiaca DW4/3-1]